MLNVELLGLNLSPLAFPQDEDDDEDEWPPFRKVGHYDPYSDDPRLAVKKVSFCAESGRLVIGGTAGQVVVCDINEQEAEKEVKVGGNSREEESLMLLGPDAKC